MAALRDPHNLQRFVEAQRDEYNVALREVRRGHKDSHWIWYIFPQLFGLGQSPMSQKFGIRGVAEAGEYLAHPVLGARLRDIAQAVLDLPARSAREVFDGDAVKLRSSATLFAQVTEPGSVFHQLLDRYFAGEPDPRTLELIAATK